VLTQAFDWRAIFVAQAPVAAFGLVGLVRAHAHAEAEEGWSSSLTRTLPANACLGLLFGALVGALFLAVLLVISVWDYSPIAGAGIVSALPLAALAVRSLRLSPLTAVCGGSALLGIGLVGLALLPSASVGFMVWRSPSAERASGSRFRCSRTRHSIRAPASRAAARSRLALATPAWCSRSR
jgi:hypothetical protein